MEVPSNYFYRGIVTNRMTADALAKKLIHRHVAGLGAEAVKGGMQAFARSFDKDIVIKHLKTLSDACAAYESSPVVTQARKNTQINNSWQESVRTGLAILDAITTDVAKYKEHLKKSTIHKIVTHMSADWYITVLNSMLQQLQVALALLNTWYITEGKIS